jgi:hypothetical protein
MTGVIETREATDRARVDKDGSGGRAEPVTIAI